MTERSYTKNSREFRDSQDRALLTVNLVEDLYKVDLKRYKDEDLAEVLEAWRRAAEIVRTRPGRRPKPWPY